MSVKDWKMGQIFVAFSEYLNSIDTATTAIDFAEIRKQGVISFAFFQSH